jgi:tRNA(fMet)-specific endonuclease VapC
MSTYLLDTNIWIYAMKGRFPEVRQRLAVLPVDRVFLSDIVVGELALGWENSSNPTASRRIVESYLISFPTLSTDTATAKKYGHIRQSLQAKGTPIGMNDLWIAAQAITHKMTLVTHNTREFSRVEGLKLEDWVVV